MLNAPITPPRVPLIDPRTGQIDRAWFLFLLSLNEAVVAVENVDVGPSAESLIASYEAALQALAQEVGTQPVATDLTAELIKQLEAAGIADQSSSLISQVAEIQKQIDALNSAPSTVITSSPLTKVDDTNVTLTLSGTPEFALLTPVQMSLGWTGTLSAVRGGTGTGNYTIGDFLYADTTTTLAKLPIGAANTVLTSSGTAPQWSTGLALTSASSIEVTDNTNAALRITQLGTGNALLVQDEANPDSSPFVVTADGRVITGATQAYAADGDTQQLQIQGLTQASSSALFANWSTTPSSEPNLVLAHSCSGTIGTHTPSVADDNLGNIIFCGSDGSVFNAGVAILAEADGTWTGSSTPAKVEFYTVPAGATSGVVAITLTSGQGLSIARTAVTSPVANDGNVFSGTYTPALTNTTNITSSAAFTFSYMRVGNVVTVQGRVTIVPASAAACELNIALPIASTLAVESLSGCVGPTSVYTVGICAGNATLATARILFTAPATTSRQWPVSFTYRVI